MTNKIALRTVQEFMADYTPVYQPVYPLFLGGKAQAYSDEVGTIEFKRLDTVGDIRNKHITPKDTHIHQINAREGSKTFKKYFLASQYVQSEIQDEKGLEDVLAQVLDENQKLQDDLFLLGEGTAGNNVINNGLFWSGDANYDLEGSIQIAKGSDADHLQDLYAQVNLAALVCDAIAGRKAVVFYGSTMLSKVRGIFKNSSEPLKVALSEALGSNYSIVELPSAVTPSATNGFIIANLDQVKLHYTALPQLRAQGVNDEKMYSWHNFMMGSMMLEVLVNKAIYRQPTTFES